jgi:nucleoside-diphosphate-sugar epimerase
MSEAEETEVLSAAIGSDESVVVTGVVGRLGKRVVRLLHRMVRVIGVDRREFPDRPKDVTHLRIDLRRKKMRDVFRAGNVRAVVHLGVMHDPRASANDHHSWNVVGFGKMLESMAQFGVKKLVVLSSASVYGPSPTTRSSSRRSPRSWGARISARSETSSRSTCSRRASSGGTRAARR